MTKTRQLKQKDLLIITRATYQIWKQTYKNQRRNFAEGNAITKYGNKLTKIKEETLRKEMLH